VAVNGLGVNGLGSTPYNIAVGGTDFDVLFNNFTSYVDVTNSLPNHRSALQYIPEEPWNDASPDDIVGGGGGISAVYPTPGWQSCFGSSTGRSLPDVSFLAGNGLYGAGWGICTNLDTDAKGNPIADCAAGSTGNSFNLTGLGGTSAAAPAFAGMLALLKQKVGARLGQADYALYQHTGFPGITVNSSGSLVSIWAMYFR
jgi:subtilase family serine protease